MKFLIIQYFYCAICCLNALPRKRKELKLTNNDMFTAAFCPFVNLTFTLYLMIDFTFEFVEYLISDSCDIHQYDVSYKVYHQDRVIYFGSLFFMPINKRDRLIVLIPFLRDTLFRRDILNLANHMPRIPVHYYPKLNVVITKTERLL